MEGYQAIIHRADDGSWWAELVDFPASTRGSADEDPGPLIDELLAGVLASYRHDDLPIPPPSRIELTTCAPELRARAA